MVFCSFRIEVYTLQISGKELFVYVKFQKKKKYYDSNNATTVLTVFFHNYAHLYKCTSYNILILIPSLQKSRLFVVCFCFFVYDCWKSYCLLLFESIYSKPEGNHYGIFISTNIELTTELNTLLSPVFNQMVLIVPWYRYTYLITNTVDRITKLTEQYSVFWKKNNQYQNRYTDKPDTLNLINLYLKKISSGLSKMDFVVISISNVL